MGHIHVGKDINFAMNFVWNISHGSAHKTQFLPLDVIFMQNEQICYKFVITGHKRMDVLPILQNKFLTKSKNKTWNKVFYILLHKEIRFLSVA